MFDSAPRVKPEDLASLLTVVVCSFERPSELRQALSFLSHFRLRAIVVDGSKAALDPVWIDSIESNSITYVHEPSPSLLHRLSLAASLVETPYSVLMFDDEYFLPRALSRAVEFLENNPEYVSCGGQAIGFGPGPEKGEVVWSGQYPNHNRFTLLTKNPLDRMVQHLSDYRMAAYCSVVRTSSWSAAWMEISKKQFLPYGVQELQFECAISFAGSMHMISDLFWLRNLKVPSIKNVGVEGLDDDLPFYRWWIRSTAKDRKSFVEVMTEVLARIDKKREKDLDLGQTSKYLNVGFTRYSRLCAREARKSRQIVQDVIKKTRAFFTTTKTMTGIAPENAPKNFLPEDSCWDPTELSEITQRISRSFLHG